MNSKLAAYTLTFASLFALGGCGDMATLTTQVGNVNSPTGVARDFWNVYFAVDGNIEHLVMPGSLQRKRIATRSGGRVVLGGTTEQDNLYFIESKYMDDSLTAPISFYTVVGSTQGDFKVNYNATIGTAFDKTTNDVLLDLSKRLNDVASTFEESTPTGDVAKSYYDNYLESSNAVLSNHNIPTTEE